MSSQYSQSMTGLAADMSDAELIKAVKDLEDKIRILRLENEVLETTINRLDPSLMNGVYKALEYAKKELTETTDGSAMSCIFRPQTSSKLALVESLKCGSRLAVTTSKVSYMASSVRICGSNLFSSSGPRININERLELISIVIKAHGDTLDKVKMKAAKEQKLLEAKSEVIDIRINDIEKENEIFEQMVLNEGWDKITQRIPAEVWIRFITESAKNTDKQIGRLRLRTSTLNVQHRKLKEDIKRKSELREELIPVDFDLLDIRINENLKTMDRKCTQLYEMKDTAGRINLQLTLQKNDMLARNKYLNKVNSLQKQREQQTLTLRKEANTISAQAEMLTQQLSAIRMIRQTYAVPDVIDYVKVKLAACDLTQDIKRLETRLKIKRLTSMKSDLRFLDQLYF